MKVSQYFTKKLSKIRWGRSIINELIEYSAKQKRDDSLVVRLLRSIK